jgi:hypothetical protein
MALDGAAGSRRLARRVAPMRGKTSPQVGIEPPTDLRRPRGRVERLGRGAAHSGRVGPGQSWGAARVVRPARSGRFVRREALASDSAEYVPVHGMRPIGPSQAPTGLSPAHEAMFPSTSADGAASQRATFGARDAGYHAHGCYPGNTGPRWGAGCVSADRRPGRRGEAAAPGRGRGCGRRSRGRDTRPQPRMTATPGSMTTPGRCSSGGRPADSESLKPGPVNDPSGRRNSA